MKGKEWSLVEENRDGSRSIDEVGVTWEMIGDVALLLDFIHH